MIYGLADVVQQRRLIEQSPSGEEHKRLSGAKLDALLGLCEAVDCRRVRLLDYFAEASTPCGNCDNCLSPPEEWDGTDAARKLMSCIYRCEKASGFGFGAQQIIDVLTGHRTEKVEQFGHDRVSTFGIGKELTALQWRALVRQLVALKLLRVDYDHFNVLRLTQACREVLNGTRVLKLRKPSEHAPTKRKPRKGAYGGRSASVGSSNVGTSSNGSRAGDSGGESNEIVFQALREWRKGVAREHGVPAYTVFHDSTLQEIARVLPGSIDDLRGISGIGATKLERYGMPLLEIVRELARSSHVG
jgi:ATP-dependent DNA helicase RecQ